MSEFAAADDDRIDPEITSYAAIGDCRAVALVSRQGSVDWLCLPNFADPSVFAALLDRRRGGRFAIRPVAPFRVERRYLEETNVLETCFITASGRARVTDLLTLNGTDDAELEAERELLRIAQGLEGEVELEVLYQPQPDYARAAAQLTRHGTGSWLCLHGGQAFLLRGEADLRRSTNRGLSARMSLRAGDTRRFSMVHATRDMLVIPPLGVAADARCRRTIDWWRRWSAQCTFDHPHRPAVVRSALALKLLAHGLSGAVVAAATTSLPEAPGATRNYDYRFCWLRDAATTLRAFAGIGFAQEGRAYLTWLLHTTRLTRPKLMVLYDIYGRTRQKKLELSHLAGYRGSRPVRVGNDASGQLQHDVYSSAIAAAAALLECGGDLASDERRLLVAFGRMVCKVWREPDSGIWEIPGGRRHYVHSKLMCWSALDVLLGMHARGQIRAPEALFRRERDQIRTAIETQGVLDGVYTGAFGEDWVDASLLMMHRLDYAAPSEPRLVATASRIWGDLARGGLLLRYLPGVDGIGSREGVFGICAFWAVELLVAQGRRQEADALFCRACARANDLGLLAEEFDPRTGAALGNVPQAFSHAGLISAALALADAH